MCCHNVSEVIVLVSSFCLLTRIWFLSVINCDHSLKEKAFVWAPLETRNALAIRYSSSGTNFKTLFRLFGTKKSSVSNFLFVVLCIKLTTQSFNVAGDASAFTLFSMCRHMTTLKCGLTDWILSVFLLHSHPYLEPSTCDQTTQDVFGAKHEQGLYFLYTHLICTSPNVMLCRY